MKPMPPDLIVPLSDSVEIPLLHIPGGTFLMGDDNSSESDEKPAHRVRLDDFYLGQFPVTQALWKAVMNGDNPSWFKGEDRPVEQVSWNRITAEFLPALQKMTGIAFRLPTEAEWEYAARGCGARSKSAPGTEAYSGSNKLKEVAWFAGNSHNETKPVGLKLPNALGLYDMSGNVWEWCQDWRDPDYYEECHEQGLVENPQGPEEGGDRVLRGGSCWDGPRNCRVAYRGSYPPAYVNHYYGFRLAASFQAVDLTLPANR